MVTGQAFLRDTASLIEQGWCQGADARNFYDHPVAASHPTATSWSLLGALVAISERPNTDPNDLRDALWGISAVVPDASLDAWNNRDGRTQSDTLEMLARAETSLNEEPPPSGEFWSCGP